MWVSPPSHPLLKTGTPRFSKTVIDVLIEIEAVDVGEDVLAGVILMKSYKSLGLK